MPKIVDRDEKRREIIEAAVATIADRGLDGATLKLIADRAGATTGTIGHYFLDKDELLVATLGYLSEQLLGPGATDRNVVIDDLELQLPLDDATRQLWRVWLAYCGAAPTSQRLLAAYDDFYARIEASVAAHLRNRAIPDAETVAGAVVAAVDGIGLCATVAPRLWPPERQETVLRSIVSGLLSDHLERSTT
ncbi:MAG: TetR/AcrR family transcriptional regulator [Actinomycetota bacterium]